MRYGLDGIYHDKSNILDISLSYQLSAEHKIALEEYKKKRPDADVDFVTGRRGKRVDPKNLDFIYPEHPCKFVPELDFTLLYNDNWIAQPKHDGWRVLIIKDQRGLRFFSRRGKQHEINMNIDIPEGTIIDGELIAEELKIPSTHNRVTSFIKKHPDKLKIVAFDILYVDYIPLLYRPLSDRLAILKDVLDYWGNNHLVMIETVDKSISTFKRLIKEGKEGIVLKCLASQYEVDGANWIKIKDVNDLELAYEYANGKRKSPSPYIRLVK